MARSASKIDAFVKLSLVFCISLLTFSMGAYVGKQMTETEFKHKQLEVEYSQQMRLDPADSIPAVADEEVQKLAEDMVKAERQIASTDTGYKKVHTDTKHKEPVKKPVAEKPVAEKPVAKKPDAIKHAAERVAKSMAPAKDPKKVRTPSKVLPTVATSAIGKYTVQVASYSKEAEAKEHAARLKAKGITAFYVQAKIQGRIWYRVSTGLFTTHKQAMGRRAEILKSQAATTAIVQRIVK